MRFLTFVNQVNKIPGFCFDNVTLVGENQHQKLILTIAPRKNSKPICSSCQRKASGYDKSKTPRLFRHVPIWNIPVYFQYVMRRVNCPHCGVKTEMVPWAQGKQECTQDFQTYLSQWAQKLSWLEVSQIFRVSWNTVYESVKKAVDWGLKHRELDKVKAIGIDEIHTGQTQGYMTLIYQIDEGARRLLAIRPERKIKSLLRCLRDLGKENYSQIEFVCSDMWKPYLNVIKRRLPQALHVLDKFHIVANLNEAVNQVRRDEFKEMKAKGFDPILKRSRYCFLKREENLTPNQKTKLQELLKTNLRTVRAYLLKESFQGIWKYKSVRWAKVFWKKWSARAMRSRLDPIKKFVKMMRRHDELIFNYWEAQKQYNSGAVEGLNRKVNLVTRRSYGYRAREVYRIALLHGMGRLPVQPTTHRYF